MSQGLCMLLCCLAVINLSSHDALGQLIGEAAVKTTDTKMDNASPSRTQSWCFQLLGNDPNN